MAAEPVSANRSDQVRRLFETVVDGGYCIGCGACAALPGSPIEMALDELGQFVPRVAGANADELEANVLAVCPFAEGGPDEDVIGNALFAPRAEYHDRIGYHLATYAGYVAEAGFRAGGSSGGVGSWVLAELLRTAKVDGVLHVRERRPSSDDPRLFAFALSTSVEEVTGGGKSRYYPVELSGALEELRERPGRYAVTGIPCYVKALRRLATEDPVLRERIRFTVALFCGHSKSTNFAELFAWQSGIDPGTIERIDFRHKLEGRPANRYGVDVVGRRGGETVHVTRPTDHFYGYLWAHGLFMNSACDYCDDVVGETADISVGDAWLPEYLEDSAGTNVVVVRNPELHALVRRGVEQGRLHLEALSPERAADSQAGGFRHRRDGLAYRLYLKDRRGEWRPPKRVTPGRRHLKRRRRRVLRLRIALAERSHTAFLAARQAGDFGLFRRAMDPLINRYGDIEAPLRRRLERRARRAAKRALRR